MKQFTVRWAIECGDSETGMMVSEESTEVIANNRKEALAKAMPEMLGQSVIGIKVQEGFGTKITMDDIPF